MFAKLALLVSIQFPNDILGAKMGVAEELPVIAVAADQSHFRDAQTFLKEPADSLVPQIVEVQIVDACPFCQPFPGLLEGARARWEDQVALTPRKAFQGAHSGL